MLTAKGRSLGEVFNVLDLTCLCDTRRDLIHAYTTGRQHLPIVEAKMARVFGLTVPALRRRLGLPSPPPGIRARAIRTVRLSLLDGQTWTARLALGKRIPDARCERRSIADDFRALALNNSMRVSE